MPYHSCQRVIGVGSVWIGSIFASVTEITLKWRLKQRANEQLLMLSLHPPLLSLLHIQSFLIYRPTNSLRCSALLSSPLLFCFTPTHDLPYQLSSLTAETQSSLLLASWPLWCSWLKSRYLTPWWLEQRTSLRALWGNPRTIHFTWRSFLKRKKNIVNACLPSLSRGNTVHDIITAHNVIVICR